MYPNAARFQVRILSTVVMLLSLIACNDAPPPAETPPTENMPITQPPPDQADTGPLERLAVADLSQRLDIPPERVRVVSAQAVTWSDGSLGCPRSDGVYTQALVEGFQIVLVADGEEHHYHAGPERRPFPCPEERRQAPIGPGRARY